MPVPAMLVAGLVAAGVAAGTAAANAAANAPDSQVPRIRELKRARARGLLTASGQADVEQGYDQARRMQTGAQEATAKQLAAMGGTSGADIKALREASDKGTSDLYSQLGQRVQEERQAEAQELEDRRALKRQRLVGTLTGSAKAGISAGSMAGQAAAYQQGKPKQAEAPDFAALAKIDPDLAAAAEELTRTQAWKRMTPEQQSAELSALLPHSETP